MKWGLLQGLLALKVRQEVSAASRILVEDVQVNNRFDGPTYL